MSAIDYARRYREEVLRSNRPEREPCYWDTRARAMSERVFQSEYAAQFIARMDLTGCETVLDVGCGPGTIGVSIASKLTHVYGLDYSEGMLAAFRDHAARRGLTNVTPILRAWDDDWSDVPVCDVVVASRATAVRDFERAALKLASKAKRRVYLTYPAHGRFIGDDIARALGRPSEPLPDSDCVLGVLHQLGLPARLDYVTDANPFDGRATFDAFAEKARALLGNLAAGDSETLREYFNAHRDALGRQKMVWAFIQWSM